MYISHIKNLRFPLEIRKFPFIKLKNLNTVQISIQNFKKCV